MAYAKKSRSKRGGKRRGSAVNRKSKTLRRKGGSPGRYFQGGGKF